MTRSRSAGRERQPRGLLGGHPAPDPLERLLEPVGVDRLQDVVDGVHRKRVDRVLVERGDEHQLRQDIGLDQPPRDFEPGQAGHLHVEEHQVRLQLAGQPQRLDAVGGLTDDFDAADLAEQKAQLLPRQLLVVDDEDAQRRAWRQAVARSGTTSSGISMRADVPWPGTLCSLQLVVRAVDHAQPFVDVAQADAVLATSPRARRSACRRRCRRLR